MSVAAFKREENTEAIAALEEILAEAKSGNLQDFVIVGNLANDGHFIRASVFEDGWRLLGALEYAKQTVDRVWK